MSEHKPLPHYFTNVTVVGGASDFDDFEATLRRAGIAALISDLEAADGTLRARVVNDAYAEPLMWTNDGWHPVSRDEIAKTLSRQFGADVSIDSVGYDGTGHPFEESNLNANTRPDYDAFAWLTTADVSVITEGASSADQDLLVVPSASEYYRSLVVAFDAPFSAANSSAWLMQSTLMMWRLGSARGFVINYANGVLGDEWNASWRVVDPSAGDAAVLAAIENIRLASPIKDYAEAFILDDAEAAQLEALFAEPPTDDTLRRFTEIIGEPSDIADVVEGRMDAADLPEAGVVSPPQGFLSGFSAFAKKLTRDRRFD